MMDTVFVVILLMVTMCDGTGPMYQLYDDTKPGYQLHDACTVKIQESYAAYQSCLGDVHRREERDTQHPIRHHTDMQHGHPCNAYVRLREPRRSVTNKLPYLTGDALCDRALKRRWYRFESPGEGGKMPVQCPDDFRCGTHAPIWLNGHHPRQRGEVAQREVCVSLGGECCSQRWHIKVANCGHYFTYLLRDTPGCFMAYCTGTTPQCPPGTTSITKDGKNCKADYPKLTGTATLTVGSKDSKVEFYCDYHGILPEGAVLHVLWFAQGDVTDEVGDEDKFPIYQDSILTAHRSTLKEKHWVSKMGSSFYCRIQAKWKNEIGGLSPAVESNKYFAGIKILKRVLMVSEADPGTQIQLQSTIPVHCLPEFADSCHIDLELAYETDYEGKTCIGGEMMQVVFGDCNIKLSPSNWEQVHEVRVKAVRDFYKDGNKVMRVNFKPIFSTMASPIWNNYQLPEVEIIAKDAPTKMCSATGDPHYSTFDGLYYHVYLEGEFVLYKSKEYPIQINSRLQKCGPHVTCNCGVAVMVEDDAIVIDRCKKKKRNLAMGDKFPDGWTTLNRYALQQGESFVDGLKVIEHDGGRKYTIQLPTGAYLDFDIGASWINIYLHASSDDWNSTLGLCGTFDDDTSNDFTHLDGITRSQVVERGGCGEDEHVCRFAESNRVAEEDSFFGPIINVKLSQHKFFTNERYCKCIKQTVGGSVIECNYNYDVDNCMQKERDKDGTDKTHEIIIHSEELMEKLEHKTMTPAKDKRQWDQFQNLIIDKHGQPVPGAAEQTRRSMIEAKQREAMWLQHREGRREDVEREQAKEWQQRWDGRREDMEQELAEDWQQPRLDTPPDPTAHRLKDELNWKVNQWPNHVERRDNNHHDHLVQQVQRQRDMQRQRDIEKRFQEIKRRQTQARLRAEEQRKQEEELARIERDRQQANEERARMLARERKMQEEIRAKRLEEERRRRPHTHPQHGFEIGNGMNNNALLERFKQKRKMLEAYRNAENEHLRKQRSVEDRNKRTKRFVDETPYLKISINSKDDEVPSHDEIETNKEHVEELLDYFEMDFISDRRFVGTEPGWPTASGITQDDAIEYCIDFILQTTVGQVCGDIVPEKLGSTIQSCVTDIKVTDDYKWAMSSLTSLISECTNGIHDNATLWTTSQHMRRNDQPSVAEKLLEDICPNDCWRKGYCRNGQCQCYHGYTGADCSSKQWTAPTTAYIQDGGLCDIRARACKTIMLYGTGFKNTQRLHCKFRNDKTSRGQPEILITRAQFRTFEQVVCPIPSHDVVPGMLEDEKSYMMSVTQDGLSTDEMPLVIYDSFCQQCSLTRDKFQCSQRGNTCSVNGVCFGEGERHPANCCLTCDPRQSTRQLVTSASFSLYELWPEKATYVVEPGDSWSLDISAVGPSGCPATYDVSTPPHGLAVQVTRSGVHVQLVASQEGDYQLGVLARDPCGGITTKKYAIYIVQPSHLVQPQNPCITNKPPTFTNQDIHFTAVYNELLKVSFDASDPDGDALTYQMTPSRLGCFTTITPDGLLRYIAPAYDGDDEMSISVRDTCGNTAVINVAVYTRRCPCPQGKCLPDDTQPRGSGRYRCDCRNLLGIPFKCTPQYVTVI